MFEISKETKDRARQRLELAKDKRSEVYFMTRFVGLVAIPALIAMLHMRGRTLGTIDGNLEFWSFIVSFFLACLFVFKRIRVMNIDRSMTLYKLPDCVSKFFFLVVFAVFASIVMVWGILNINRVLDTSQPAEILGEIKSRNVGVTAFLGSTFEIGIRPNLPNVDRVSFKMPEKVYSERNIGERVILVIKNGTFGCRYIAAVKPFDISKRKV